MTGVVEHLDRADTEVVRAKRGEQTVSHGPPRLCWSNRPSSPRVSSTRRDAIRRSDSREDVDHDKHGKVKTYISAGSRTAGRRRSSGIATGRSRGCGHLGSQLFGLQTVSSQPVGFFCVPLLREATQERGR
jgi:hypothetical protein